MDNALQTCRGYHGFWIISVCLYHSVSSNLEIGALSIFAIVVFLRLLGFRDLSFSF